MRSEIFCPRNPVLKRAVDLALAAFGLVILVVPFCCVAIAIVLDSSGPVYFTQTRIGRNRLPFRIVKFRTMVHTTTSEALKPDGEVTRVGRVLRKTKLDELPQLFNVLAGQMSLVGPRPEVSEFFEKYSDSDKQILASVRPGLTDFASIKFRDEGDVLASQVAPLAFYERVLMPAKMRYYRFYIERQSIQLDIYLILLTVLVLGKEFLARLTGKSCARGHARPIRAGS